jgi:AraC family transcriptional regulator of adaptative response / DNA-3-methyladenine glycosylase II
MYQLFFRCYRKDMEMTKTEYYKALTAHDRRFDGLFFTCVKTTGIYCRPVCPTHPPRLENCSFVSTAAEAEKHGYRPCLRCRPELAPAVRESVGSPARQLGKHIEDTLLMDETLGKMAQIYGVSERHLRRTFLDTYGVEPKQFLTTRRLLFAKQLLQDTEMSVADVAYSAGFNSPGRLTVNMRTAYGFTPERFRKDRVSGKKVEYITLRADYRPPFDWATMLTILTGRATPLEWIEQGTYNRLVDGFVVTVSNASAKNRLHIRLPIELSRQSHTILQKVRNLFDLDANPLTIQDTLSEDSFMEGLLKKYPGVRVPGTWDNFELLVRVIIGQRISVVAATTLMRRLVDRIGITPDVIASSSPATIAAIGLPMKRAEAIVAIATLVQSGRLNLAERDPVRFYDQLVTVPGIGPWTAEYMLMRALHWPDAFPVGDLGVQKAMKIDGQKQTEKQLIARAAQWRPWRSYATMLLWQSIANQGG